MSKHIPYEHKNYSESEQIVRSQEFLTELRTRRSVRFFSPTPIPSTVLENIIATAATAPSGANKQPWRFVVVTDPDLKRKIRIAAEAEEKKSYEERMPEEWLADLAPLGTDWHKEFLETAPALITVFAVNYELSDGKQHKNYYVKESVGIACGFLLAAIHRAGLVALTHTPSPMDFLQRILDRPENERPFLLIPVGFPAKDATVPDIMKKPLTEISLWKT